MRAWRDDLPITLAFFSRVPVGPVRHGRRLSDAVWVLPIASVLIAVPAVVVLVGAWWLGVGALAAAVAATATLTITTGALHEDGFADCADGFFGGAAPDRRLEIMADSRIGAYGTLALIFAIGLKAALLSSLLAAPLAAAAAFMASAIVARTVALYPWVGLPAARQGLAAAMGRPTGSTFRLATVLALIVSVPIMAFAGFLAALIATAAAVATAIAMTRLAERMVGGHTGDVIGATVIAADLSYLAAVTMWLS